MNNSSTAGYLQPSQPQPQFNGLSFEQFLQTFMVGVSSLPGDLVRPKWQLNPPKQPDATVNWLAIGLNEDDSDTNAYVDGSQLMRMDALSLQCSFYGPLALEYARLTRDNLQVGQNLEPLLNAKMSFVNTSRLVRAPDIVNERWVDRWEMTVYLRQEILRTYPILDLVGGSGTIKENNAGDDVRTITIAVNGQEN